MVCCPASAAASFLLMPDVIFYLLWIGSGSAFGGAARYFVSGVVARAFGETFPWGTLVVNGSGAAVIGVVSAVADAGLLEAWPQAWPLLVIGFLASYTTVSSVSLQTLALVRQGAGQRAAANVALSLTICLGAVAAAHLVTGAILAGGAS
jgi:fluoride exporter